MDDEWRYLVSTDDCYINTRGEVTHQGELLEPYRLQQTKRHRWVDLVIRTRVYDYDRSEWSYGPERTLVHYLMLQAWFVNWSSDFRVVFVDRDPWNCSIDNIRAESKSTGRFVEVREDGNYLAFDKRMRGNVEVIELGQVYSGVAAAARAMGGTKAGVSKVLSGDLESHHGYHFRWVTGYI